MKADRDISRRELLRGRFLARALGGLAAGSGLDLDETVDAASPPGPPGPVMRYPRTGEDVRRATRLTRRRGTIPLHRPPGAVDEPTFLAECTRCDACIEACPHDAIAPAPARFREATGTPMIDPDRRPCMMCDDLPCVAACEPDVLTPLLAAAMGTARIVEQTCLAHQGSFCSVCVERCPVEGAIEVTKGRPRVREATCTGCGVCRHVCPAPENAVLLMPAFTRPVRPDEGTAHAG